MAYEPTNWQTGDVVTAEKLNNIESGISANESIIVTFPPTYTDGGQYNVYLTSDLTSTEVINGYKMGKPVIFHIPEIEGYIETHEFWTPCIGIRQDYIYQLAEEEPVWIFYINTNISGGYSEIWAAEDGYIHCQLYVD